MTNAQWLNAVREGNPTPVCLLDGPDLYGKREAMKALCEALLPVGLETLNYTVLEDACADKIIEAAVTMPVMCEKRIVEVRDWAPFFSSKSKNEEAEVEKILKYMETPSPECVLVFHLRQDADHKKKLTKAFTAARAPFLVDFPMPADAELQKWATEYCAQQGGKITRPAVDRLIFAAGRDRTRLEAELSKLIAYAGNDAVTPQDVDRLVAPSLEYKVYLLTDMLLAGKLENAQEAVDSMIAAGEARTMIFASLVRQMGTLTHVRLAADERHLPETLEQLGIKGYRGEVLARQAKLHPANVYRTLYESGVQMDFDFKRGALRDKVVLNTYILQIFAAFTGK